MVITAGELRSGNIVERAAELYQVVDFAHVKQGRGTAFVRVKFKNLSGHSVTEDTFRPEEKFIRAVIERREMQYLYKDNDSYIFMDISTYDQISVSAKQLGAALEFMKENNSLFVNQYEGKIVGVEMPITVDLEVAHTEPGYKGDTANPGTKPATLETGYTIDVPLFIDPGDKVKVDTRTGKYIERL